MDKAKREELLALLAQAEKESEAAKPAAPAAASDEPVAAPAVKGSLFASGAKVPHEHTLMLSSSDRLQGPRVEKLANGTVVKYN